MASSYSNIHPVDEILSNLAIEAVQGDNAFIADRVFETVAIPERSGTLLIENNRNFTGAGAGLDNQRAPGADRQLLSGFDRSNTTYKANIFSWRDGIAMEDIIDSQYPGSEEQRMVRKVARAMQISREKRCADLLFNTSEFTNAACTALQTGVKWDATGANPLTDLHALKDTVFDNSGGMAADSLILGRGVFRTLARNPEIRGYVGSTGNGLASGQLILSNEAVLEVLRSVLGIPNVYVANAINDSAPAGATSSESQIWNTEQVFMGILRGGDALVNRNGVKMGPMAAINFRYGAMQAGAYDNEQKTRRYVWSEEIETFKKIDSNFGFVVTDCLT